MKSKHIKKRMSQRGIRSKVVNLVLEYGLVMQNNKRMLNCKAIDSLICDLDSQKQALLDARRKGGVAVVVIGDTLVTTYGLGH